MAGLNLRVGGGASASTGVGMQSPYSTAPAGSTITEQAFGFGNGSPASTGGGFGGLAPTNATGIAFWSGVAGLSFLLILRHSLPR